MSPLETMIDEQRRLLMGADPRPDATVVDPKAAMIRLPARGPLKDHDGEEILRGIRPSIRYGIGVLFPKRLPAVDEADRVGGPTAPDPDEVETPDAQERAEDISGLADEDCPPDDLKVEFKQVTGRPRSIGVSFLAEFADEDVLEIKLEGGRYIFHSVPADRVLITRPREDDPSQSSEEHPQNSVRLYQRSPVCLSARLSATELGRQDSFTLALNGDAGPLQIELYIRVRKFSDQLLV